MKQFFLLLLLLFLFQLYSYGQRSRRTAQSAVNTFHVDTFAGHYVNITLTNNDTIPFLLRLGQWGRIRNNDTLRLARTYPCSNTSIGEYYDLDYLVSEENNCVSWYTLQLIKPKDTLQFTVKLKDFAKADSARLYFCFTKEITKEDRDLELYSDPKKIFIMKDGRDFKSTYVNVSTTASNLVLLQNGNQ